jgi:hypothetical protein
VPARRGSYQIIPGGAFIGLSEDSCCRCHSPHYITLAAAAEITGVAGLP